MSEKNESRDWELTCDHCNGDGFVYVERQVAERKSDVQELKEECECCEGRGFTIAYEDIPGIAKYVKSCRAPSAPGDAQDERQAFEAWAGNKGWPLSPYQNNCGIVVAERYGHRTVQKAWEAWQERASAPAAGDALDAARYRAIRNPPYSDRYGDLYAMTFQGDGDIPLKGDALDAAADAAIAQQKGEA